VNDAVRALAERLGPMAQRDVALGPLTTYGVGGAAALFVTVVGEAELNAVAQSTAGSGVEVLVVGLGSNLLVADNGFDGLVVVLGADFAEVTVDGTRVRAGARAKLPVVARQSAAAGLRGFEWAAGVPGSIGGAVRMNAGVPDAEMGDVLVRAGWVDLISGAVGEVEVADLHLGYRSSSVASWQVVTWAELDLEPGDPMAARELIGEKTRWRRENQPGGHNAGSVFTNPEGDSAGRLIDAAGCKGLRVGTAEVSTKHANFIQVDDGGLAADVWSLMEQVRRRVFDHVGVALHPETCVVGLDPLFALDGEP
jgi:UDP-N-acetylmuramate dehydrogenase